ncbi:uncharacterized protein LOC131666500 [Phymastichus coffea]|uniref:uncharacterized protein LOC131666500 n=1 Tax=Phymastichus coffea TaxID=108790 RepID=UPI00273AB0CB|nr:uncharacterized protein LOC131666500 [Phymastichus coffea]
MTYYVVNNYVRRPQQQVKNAKYQQPMTQDERFVPSVQYDPKELGPDSDTFLPLRYDDKGSYEDYTAVRTPKPVAILQSTIPEIRYHTTSPPEYTKLVSAKPAQPDYPSYGQEFESVRFVPQLPKAPPRSSSTVRYATTRPSPQTPPRVSLNHVLKSLQLTNQLPEVLSKDNIDSSIKTLVDILNILNAGKKENYPSTYGKLKTAPNTKSKVITESNYEATQFSLAPQHDEFKTARPYVKQSKIPYEDYIETKPLNPYVNQIKTPLAISADNLVGQLKSTRPYLRPIQGFTTPIPTEDLVDIKPISTYVKQMKTPSQDLLDLKPYVSYVKQVKAQPTVPNDELIDIKPYVDQAQINHYTKASVPIRYDDLIEVKQPMSIYLDPSKIPQESFEQAKTPKVHGEDDDAKTYVQTTETRTPMPPTQDIQKIVQYYVPIVQDIDEETAVAYKPVNKDPAMSPSIEHASKNNYIHQDAILEDERLTLPVNTEEPPKIAEPTIPPVLKYGATRGKPHVDYPAYTEIPETEFSCKQQRYKGFFGDPQTGCQVWHYCDLNGGKSSFLCPNGTIFNQVALTCDWWFNVKCESTTQLYVLNERLYKYILPVMPKFPEDFTGPEVDKYLELKFKEMEAKMMMEKKKKKEERQDEKDKSPINTLQSIEDSKKR